MELASLEEEINPEKDVLIDEYDTYVVECKAALDIAMARVKNLQAFLARREERSPFDRVECRIKDFESTIEKCRRRGYELSIESIKSHIFDIAGIRIITKFPDEINEIARMIEMIPGINVVSKKDYVKNPKPNGYRSLHLGAQIEIYDPEFGSKLIPVEIQIRDKAMNLWGSLEHVLRYKNPDSDPETEQSFREIAELLVAIDAIFINMRDKPPAAPTRKTQTTLDEISNPVEFKASVSSEDPAP